MNILGFYIPDEGCGAGSCLVRRPIGQHTNGGCTCAQTASREFRFEIARELDRIKQQQDASK